MFRNVLNVSPGFLIPDDFKIRHPALLRGVDLRHNTQGLSARSNSQSLRESSPTSSQFERLGGGRPVMKPEISCRYRTACAVPLLFGAENRWHWACTVPRQAEQRRRPTNLCPRRYPPAGRPTGGRGCPMALSAGVVTGWRKASGPLALRQSLTSPDAGEGSRGLTGATEGYSAAAGDGSDG
jgi:hypothetical protein